MDRKELLLKLCKELTETVEIFYSERAFLGEVLVRYASVLSDIGYTLTWADEKTQDKVFKIIEDAFKKKYRLKCRLEEWLSWKISEIVNEALNEEKPKQTETRSEELPF
jgi:hypothetical protein